MPNGLAQLQTLLRSKGLMDDLVALGGGIVDGFLIDKSTILFLIKNIGIPIIDKLGFKLPNGLVKESEGMLGLTLYLLMTGGEQSE